MKILGIETSCDETAASVVEVKNSKIRVLSNVVSSQVKLHAKYGGVVPNLAAREHEKNLPRVFRSALKKSKSKMADIDLIAVTRGPGLSPALWRGINFAKEISAKYKKPILGVNHLEGHIYSNFLEKVGVTYNLQPITAPARSRKGGTTHNFPILNLIVSGGHTELVLMQDYGKYKVIGETLDDAVGEAFDKVARLLGLGYPGGPQIARHAEQFARTIADFAQINADNPPEGDADQRRTNADSRGIFQRESASSQRESAGEFNQIEFPRPMINQKNHNFSYSGLKTAVLYKVRDIKNAGVKLTASVINEICHEFQNAALDVLVYKTIKAAQEYKAESIFLSGGVSANKELRSRLEVEAKKLKVKYSQPEMEYTGDNAAMIAVAGYFSFLNNKKTDWQSAEMNANLGFRN